MSEFPFGMFGGDPEEIQRQLAGFMEQAQQQQKVAFADDVSEPSEETMDYRETMIAEQGQTMAEYAVVLTVITVAIVVTLSVLSTSIIGLVSSVVTAM